MPSPRVNEQDLAALGTLLHEARRAAGLSLYDVAGADLSAPALCKLEKGKACPTADRLMYLAGRLHLDLPRILPLWARCQRRAGQRYLLVRLLREAGHQTAARVLVRHLEEEKVDHSNPWSAWIALEKGLLALDQDRYEEALDSSRQAAVLANQHSDWECQAEAHALAGIALRYLWRPTSAIRHLQAAARQARPHQPLHARVLIHLAHAQLDAGLYRPALDIYESIRAHVHEPPLAESVPEGKAFALERLGQPDTALQVHRVILRRYEADGEPRSIARVLNNMGLCHKRMDDWREARSFWQESLQVQTDGFDAACTLEELAQSAVLADRREQAMEYVDRAESFVAPFPRHPSRATLTLLREGILGADRTGPFPEWSRLLASADPELRSLWIQGSAEAALYLCWRAPLNEALAALNEFAVGMLASGPPELGTSPPP